jgi:phosphopantothenoylcysteine decarboxylase/phosphopantothenate--cysteine ligase
MLRGKNIILGVCGSIAAYKSALLIRLLVKAQANVQVIMTPDAVNFITPLTLSVLSKNPILVDSFDSKSGVWTNHVELGLWADAFIIAPISANSLAKISNGICDNLLTAVYLSARCPVYFAPAMDLDMWAHPSTQTNVERILSYGNKLIAPASGELASGLEGEGRMAEPEEIIQYLKDALLENNSPLNGKKVLITAGPTYEAIDPVRFIGNHSSGKMGFALAEVFQKLGAQVTLISGPTSISTPNRVTRINITSASEMLQACLNNFEETDILIMSAAVADYRPKEVAVDKIKKDDDSLTLNLEKTTDILKTLGTKKRENQILVGFALETNNELANAEAKLKKKNLDLIILNSLKDEGAGFAGDQNKITTIDSAGNKRTFDLKPKIEVAKDIAQEVLSLLTKKQ